jgi:hypothetical protein
LPITLRGIVCTSASASNDRARARHSRKFSGWTGDRAFGQERLLTQNDEPIRAGIRQRSKEDAVDEREDCGVGADAEGDGQYRNRAESRALSKRAQRVCHILTKAIEQREAPRVAALLFPLLDRAHLTHGSVVSLLRGHAPRDVVVDEVLHVIAKLLVELLLHPTASEERTNTQTNLADPAHGRSGSLLSLTDRSIARLLSVIKG